MLAAIHVGTASVNVYEFTDDTIYIESIMKTKAFAVVVDVPEFPVFPQNG